MNILLRHIWVLGFEEIRELLGRRRSILSLLLHIGIFGLIIYLATRVQQRLGPFATILNSPGVKDQFFDKMRSGQFSELMRSFEELGNWPVSIWFFHYGSIALVPLLIMLVSADIVSRDNDLGTLRFILQRTSRLAYFASKFFSHVVTIIGVQLALGLVLISIIWVRTPGFPIILYLNPLFRSLLALFPWIMLMVGVAQFVSVFSKKPFDALIKLNILWTIFSFLPFKYPKLTPLNSSTMQGILVPTNDTLWTMSLNFFGWTAGFLALGYLIFSRRDV